MVRYLLIALIATGCTFDHGTYAAGLPDGGTGEVDAPTGLELDASDVATDGSVDSPPDPTIATLSQNVSAQPSDGKAIYCHANLLTVDNAWYRAFRPSDDGINAPFTISKVMFASEDAKSASITVVVHAYDGPLGGATLDPSHFTQLASIAGTVADSMTPQTLHTAMVSATIPAGGVFVVEIRSTDTQNSSGIKLTYFHLGANNAGASAPGYYKSSACGVGSPTAQSAGHDFIIRVEGAY